MLLTDRIYEALFQAILTGEFQPGGAFLTEQAVMDRFHASRITVRRALARLEENRIITRKQKVGATVNSAFSAANGVIRTIGAVMPLHEAFTRTFLSALCAECSAHDAVTVLEPAESGIEQNQAVIRLVLHGVRDLVIWGLDRDLDRDLFLRLRILGVNIVFFDRIAPGKIADYVVLDTCDVMRRIFDRMAKMKIEHVYFMDSAGLDLDTSRERIVCCEEECRRRGISFASGKPAVFPPHSAVMAVNDPEAIQHTGYGIPVFSIDGSFAARDKGVYTCRQPIVRMAQRCFTALCDQRRLGEKWHAREFRLSDPEPWK